jgi:lipopolysaccharide transport system permease protein
VERFLFLRNGLFQRAAVLWRSKEIVYGIVKREFQGRYLNSLFGIFWSFFQPVALIIVYTVIFSKILGARISGVEDPLSFGLFLCAGILPWGYFAELLGRCPNLFLEHANLIKKINFPRIVLPVSLFFSVSINFIVIFGTFLFFLLITGRFPGASVLAFIPLLMFQQLFALGVGMIVASLNVFFRDIGHFVQIVLQFWFWLTPIVYPKAILSPEVVTLLNLNPMTWFVSSYQQIILTSKWPSLQSFGWAACISILILFLGYITFQNLSNQIVDEI